MQAKTISRICRPRDTTKDVRQMRRVCRAVKSLIDQGCREAAPPGDVDKALKNLRRRYGLSI